MTPRDTIWKKRGTMTALAFRRALKKLDLRPTDAARLFGVERSTVGRWMKGERKIPRTAEFLVRGYVKARMKFHS